MMATVRNRSTLGIRYLDTETQKEKTFNIGYINPENTRAISRILANKVWELSSAGIITQVYITDVTNITDTDTDTATSSATTEG